MKTIHELVVRYFPMHKHLVCVSDMATCKTDGHMFVVGFKYTCVLCGKTITETTTKGLELLSTQPYDTFEWLVEKETK